MENFLRDTNKVICPNLETIQTNASLVAKGATCTAAGTEISSVISSSKNQI